MKSIHFNGSDETVELLLRTIISFSQLSVYGAVPDLCGEWARDSSSAGKPAANGNLGSMVIPTEFPAANPISQTDADVQGSLLREYDQKFAELPEQQKLTKLCSNAGFSKIIGKGQFFITLDEEGPDEMKTSYREYSLLRSDESPRVRGWIRGNTKIGPALAFIKDVTVLRSSSNLCFETELLLGFVSWTESTNA